ncbi:50S ribosomal protein L32e [Candidatus Pacearchaeota archaeon]|nr:50S ribosomal protein L32e [Candidatus Pacearchaeota archaeon]
MSNKTFVRRNMKRFSKLGKNRKKLQRWKRPKGRDNKMRLKRKSYPATVSVGYSSPRKEHGRINGQIPVLVYNIKDLGKLGSDNVAILAKVGAKKKLEIIKFAEEKKIKILNVRNVQGDKNETRN